MKATLSEVAVRAPAQCVMPPGKLKVANGLMVVLLNEETTDSTTAEGNQNHFALVELFQRASASRKTVARRSSAIRSHVRYICAMRGLPANLSLWRIIRNANTVR